MGEEESMKMAPGAKALPGRVPEQDPGDPRSLFSMAAEIGIASGKSTSILGVSSSGVKIGAKGGTERGHQAARRVLGVT